ncbi:MAG: Gfo/Idh/MocA family protein [Candidatus Freyarchaeota archaeon]
MKPLGVGFIGCGRIFDLHVLGYQKTDKAKIVALCDSRRVRAKKRARELGLSEEKIYRDYNELLRDEEVDMVEILLPHYLHKDAAVAAAEAGKHVSVQKPPAMNVREMEELMDAGEIGEPHMIRIKMTSGSVECGWEVPMEAWMWRFTPEQCGGGPTVWDDGYHKFSIARYFMGDIDRVYAWIESTELGPGLSLDSPAIIMWKYKSPGKMGVWDTSFAPEMVINSKYYATDERVEITGTRGYLWINQCTGQLLDVPPLVMYRDGELTCFQNLRKDWADSFIDSTLHFVDCILEDKEPILSGEEGKKVLQFALAALKSAETHTEVSPDEIKE